ncbi:hypothetical protein [Sphingomonas rubra]|uniref:Conserved repeat domain-containing protein n=1 Tax=Sphingomonas rubra TaxID=634430 RepID=A0A1I5TW05_9SPHN|nr:hypothetical protein [Sphingomonas rubra]SFP87234.1 conserved repeat domain-containing protein [Sphingomonas rubra]
MIRIVLRRLLLSGTAAVAAAVPGGQAAAQTASTATPAGTTVSNTAQATYSVNGATQTVQSNTATFVVDRKVNLTVVKAQNADTSVALGQIGAVTAFRVTNNTNGTQDFLLDPDQNLGTIIYVGTDNYDMTNLKAYVDVNDNGTYEPGTDVATFIDELKPDEARTVFLVGDVPTSQLAQLAIVSLHVTVAEGGAAGTAGARLRQTTLNVLNQDNEVDVVFADNDSDGIGGDGLHDGEARAYLAYDVGVKNVDLTVNKSMTILSDGVSTLNPKALPGAVVEYCLSARNATLLTAAANVTLTDIVPANTTYVAQSLTIGVAGGTCVLLGQGQDDDADDANDPGPYRGSYDATARRVTAIIPSLAGSTTINASFRVTIN